MIFMDGVAILLPVNTYLLLSADPNIVSPIRTSIELFSQIIICLVGIGGIAAFFLKGKFKTLQAIRAMANTVNTFMEKVIPDLLQGFEAKGFVPKGTLADWAKTIGSGAFPTHSPKKLSKHGKKLLEQSGMLKIVDDHLEAFIKELEDKKLKSPLDIERGCFYLLLSKENEEFTLPLKDYLYTNPTENINIILYTGALYLCDKYFEKHPKALENIPEKDSKQNEDN